MWQKAVSYINSYCAKPERPALVIDGLSDLAEASLGSVLSMAGKWVDTNPKNTTMAEWGTAISQLERLMWKIRSSESLVVMVGHTKEVERDGVTTQVPSVYGKQLPGKLAASFDEVWYTRVTGWGEKRVFRLQSISSAGVECKSRRQLPEGSEMNLGMEGLLGLIGWKWEETK